MSNHELPLHNVIFGVWCAISATRLSKPVFPNSVNSHRYVTRILHRYFFLHLYPLIENLNLIVCRSQWPHGLRRRSGAARLLRSWVRNLPGAWMFVCCECCVLSGRSLCDGLITRPEESYRLWCVVVCDLENLKNEEAMTRVGSQRHKKILIVKKRSGSQSK